jgi:hypothetical protein
MFGDPEWESSASAGEKGVVYEAVQWLLGKSEEVKQMGGNMIIECSFFEVYNEQVRDLVQREPGNLALMDNKDGGVTIKNLKSYRVRDIVDLSKIIFLGNSKRVRASTSKNKYSSRSHAIVQITVSVSKKMNGQKSKFCKGKLTMVDLAGSEKLDSFDRKAKQRGMTWLT